MNDKHHEYKVEQYQSKPYDSTHVLHVSPFLTQDSPQGNLTRIEEIDMNQSIIHSDYPLTHPGVERAEKVISSIQSIGQSLSASRTIAVMLLAAVAAAFIVVADQMIETWAEGHLLAAWVAMWALVFAAIGLFAGVFKALLIQTKSGLDAMAAKMAQRRADARLWAMAQSDARLMSELQIAMTRGDDDSAFSKVDAKGRMTRLMRQGQYGF